MQNIFATYNIMRLIIKVILSLTFLSCQSQENAVEDWQLKAEVMVKEQIEKRGIKDKSVLEAVRNTPRHKFVPAKYADKAYIDGPLPIGHGQTISQPYVVALMSELMQLKGEEKVLEIGTGSGYQAAILSQLASQVFTIEIVQNLVDRSKPLLNQLGYKNITVRHGDGYEGWEEEAPFDAIMVTASPETIPEKLLQQLKVGGRLVLPVGKRFQKLKVITKNENGVVSEKTITSVRFVPMVHPEDTIKTGKK